MLYEVGGGTLPSLVDSGRDDGRDRVLYEVVGEHSLHLSTVGEMIVGTGCYISGGTLPSLVDSGRDDGRDRVHIAPCPYHHLFHCRQVKGVFPHLI